MSLRLLNHALRDFERVFANLEEPFSHTAFRSPSTPFLTSGPLARATAAWHHRPSVDLSETAKEYYIEAELPGARREDIDLEFQDGNTIVLKGTIGAEYESSSPPAAAAGEAGTTAEASTTSSEVVNTNDTTKAVTADHPASHVEQPTFWERERMVGSFRRQFTFPTAIDADQVKATFRDGILSVKIPKLEQRVNKIQIADQ
ncbi:hypothetical protein HDV00_009146 [Rhizophlyctis rosea]|nr:hypothetical protein HDV00_009146 [Rhizophlyctis rosea]